MRYLFFDTESSNCFSNIYKMCEWGSLITDEAFSVFPGTKRDVLMNPGRDGKFNLTGRKDGRDLILAHPYEDYKAAPLFENQYDNIKFLLVQKELTIFLWASENDIQALLDQCFRYRLPKIAFVSYDVQMLFKAAFPEIKGTPSLEKAMELLGLSMEGITAHRPDDDALMTSMILKALCVKAGKTVKQLIDECPRCRMESISAYLDMQKRHKAKMEIRRLDEARKKALAPFNAALNEIFAQGVPEGAPREKTFSVSAEMKRHIDETLGGIKIWLERGFFLKRNLNVPCLVYYDEEEREKLATHLDLTNLKLVSIEEFDALTKGE